MIFSQAIALFALAQQPTGGALIPDWEVTLPGGVVPAAQGSLNAYGKKAVRVNFRPGQIPAAAIGLSLHFCAVAREPWAGWTRCSEPVEIAFVP